MCRRDPLFFRDSLVIDAASRDPRKFGDVIAPFQEADFEAMAPTLKWVAGVSDAVPKVRRFFIQRGRGSSKTSDLAICVLYLVAFGKRMLDMCVAAEDKEQSTLILKQAEKILANNAWLRDFVSIQRTKILNNRTGSSMVCLSRDKFSSFGLTPDLVIVDEFTHVTQPGFWHSLVSSFTKKERMLIVACNAGTGYDWHWDVKQFAIDSPLWYHNSPHGHAPWYSKEAIDEQRALLSIHEFNRLWLNEWQDAAGEFVSLSEADACIDPNLSVRSKTVADGYWYVASLDYAEKHDRTVGCVAHIYNGKIIVDRMDVVVPERLDPQVVPVAWCEEWIEEVSAQFGGKNGNVFFVLDKYQLLGSMQRLETAYPIEPFEFKGGIGNWEMALILRHLILQKQIHWYPGCGSISNNGLRDDLSTELASLITKTSANGRWRFDHTSSGYDDRAFALGACCRFIVMNCGGLDEWGLGQSLLQTKG